MKREIAWAKAFIALVAVAFAGCGGPAYSTPKEVEAKPPKVSYDFTTDEGLIEANAKARTYCSQYAATPSMTGSITKKDGDTRTVTFECIKTPPIMPPATAPATPPTFSYRTDIELMQAIQSADAYCARNGQVASSSITTNPDGTKTLMFQCVAR